MAKERKDHSIMSSINQRLQNIVNSAAAAAGEAKTAVRTVSASVSRQMADKYDSVRLRMELGRLGSEQQAVFSDIGRLLFMVHTGAVGKAVETPEGEKTPQQLIDALFVRAEQLRQEMEVISEKLKAGAGRRVCPCCGRACAENDVFCAICGTKLDGAGE